MVLFQEHVRRLLRPDSSSEISSIIANVARPYNLAIVDTIMSPIGTLVREEPFGVALLHQVELCVGHIISELAVLTVSGEADVIAIVKESILAKMMSVIPAGYSSMISGSLGDTLMNFLLFHLAISKLTIYAAYVCVNL